MEIKDGYEYYEYYAGNAGYPKYWKYRLKDGILKTSDETQEGIWSLVEDHSFFNEHVLKFYKPLNSVKDKYDD